MSLNNLDAIELRMSLDGRENIADHWIKEVASIQSQLAATQAENEQLRQMNESDISINRRLSEENERLKQRVWELEKAIGTTQLYWFYRFQDLSRSLPKVRADQAKKTAEEIATWIEYVYHKSAPLLAVAEAIRQEFVHPPNS